MNQVKPARGEWNELLQFEQQLRSGLARAGMETRDVELARLLSGIDRRRRNRSRSHIRIRGEMAAGQPAQRPAADPGTVLEVERIGTSVAILRVARPQGMRFAAGQHIKLGIAGVGKNPYTIASAPSDPLLELCIERVPGGRLSTRLCELKAGARIELDAKPKGDFVLEPAADLHVMIATVTGISPFRSMLREAAAQNSWSRFVVLHGASFADELVYRSELEELARRHPDNLRYIPSVSRPGDPRNRGFEGATGRVTALAPSIVQELQASSPGQRIQAYACGHPEMVQTVHTELGAMGLPVASEVFD